MEENKVAQMSDNDLHLIAERIWLRLRNERRASADELNDIFRELVVVRNQTREHDGGIYSDDDVQTFRQGDHE